MKENKVREFKKSKSVDMSDEQFYLQTSLISLLMFVGAGPENRPSIHNITYKVSSRAYEQVLKAPFLQYYKWGTSDVNSITYKFLGIDITFIKDEQ